MLKTRIMSTKNPHTKVAITIIEEETGKPIESIPKTQLLNKVNELSILHFKERGIECNANYLPILRRSFKKRILEGSFNQYVIKLKNQQKSTKSISIGLKYRAKYEIQVSILESSKDGLSKTQIMYKNNLSRDILRKYLDGLIKLGFLEFKLMEKWELYTATKLGLDYCRAFEPLKKALNGEDFESNVLDKKSREKAIYLLHKIEEYKNRYDICVLVLESASEPKTNYDIYKNTDIRPYSYLLKYIEFLTKLTFLEKLEKDLFQRTPFGSKYYEAYLYFIHYLA